jgi:flagellar protein FlaG
MLTELQGALHPSFAPQARVAVPASSPIPAANDSGAHSAPAPTTVDTHAAATTPKVQAPKPADIKVDIEKMRANLQESIEKVNQLMRDGGRNLNFSMDKKLGGLVILVKNADTGEVVRQIPSDAVVRMAHSLDDFKGMLHNELS